MRRSHLTEEQIFEVLKEGEAGRKLLERHAKQGQRTPGQYPRMQPHPSPAAELRISTVTSFDSRLP